MYKPSKYSVRATEIALSTPKTPSVLSSTLRSKLEKAVALPMPASYSSAPIKSATPAVGASVQNDSSLNTLTPNLSVQAGSSPIAPVSDPSAQDNSLQTANNIGILTNKYSIKDSVGPADPVDYYKFDLSTSDAVSIFFNGLSAGYTLELLDGSGNVLQNSINSGTTWTSTNSGITGGSITSLLSAGTYYVRVTPAAVTGNPLYSIPGVYTLNLQLHNAPNTVTVAASNTGNATGIADYICSGSNDQNVIEQAIAAVAAQGGGTVLLMEGTGVVA
jgi:hypothetical protein